jgi:hypothetical protein
MRQRQKENFNKHHRAKPLVTGDKVWVPDGVLCREKARPGHTMYRWNRRDLVPLPETESEPSGLAVEPS